MRVGLGTSEQASSSAAGREAASAALAPLRGASPALVMVYASVRYDLAALLAAVRAVTGPVPLAGASTSGHFHNGDITQPGSGVAVLALAAGPYHFRTAAVTGLRADPFGTGRAVARAVAAPHTTAAPLPHAPLPHAGILLLSCGLTGDQQLLLAGVHRVTGAGVPVVGGAASDDGRMSETYVFHGDEVLADAAVAVWIGSPRPLRVVHGHGWRPVGLPQLVTDVDGPVVRAIAGRAAIEVFREHLGAPWAPDDPTPAGRGGRHAAGGPVRPGEVGRAFGLVEADGSVRLRGVFVDRDGEVRTAAPLPQYSAIQVMACTQDGLLGVCDSLAERATTRPAPAGPDSDVRLLLAFSCVARYEMLRERAVEEAKRLHAAAGGAQTFGFYTYGEFARTTSVAGFHTATITAMAL